MSECLSNPCINIRSFLQIAPYLARRGVCALEFFRRLGISPNVFQTPDLWLPRDACFRIANALSAIADDAFAGAHVGQLTELTSLGAWGSSVTGSMNVAQACAMAACHAERLHQGGRVHIVTEGRTTKLIHRFAGNLGEDPRQFVFGSLAVLRKIPLMAGDASSIRVHMKAPRARGDSALEACMGPDLVMGADYDMVEFDRDLLDSPLRLLQDDASKVTKALQSTITTAGLLLSRIADQDQSKLNAVAKDVGMSPRTLQRRLKESGVDFETLLDETRRGEALRLIRLGRHSATEIAYMVGYSDPAHFTRAFKRWTGRAPSRFRAAALGSD